MSSYVAALRDALDRNSRVNLLESPTPVRKLARGFPGLEVWLKDDSLTHPIYGGNKPRKLEYLIARAKHRNQAIVTFGFESSNHAIASAYHCSEQGVACHLILVRGPSGLSPADERAKDEKLAVVRRLAASVETVETYPQAAKLGMKKWLGGLGKLRLVPPGGSNALGTLGFVRAAVELAEQIGRGELPQPSAVFVPLGTGGTGVGLAIGLAAAGLATKVIAVKVVPGKVSELPRLRWIARQVRKLLPAIPAEHFKLSNLVIDPSALGGGYGIPTVEGLRVIERWQREENIVLDATYSGKAAAALERHVHTNANSQPVVFWLTYSDWRRVLSSRSR